MPSPVFSEEVYVYQYYLSFECLIEFTSATIWAWNFLLGEVFANEFNFKIHTGLFGHFFLLVSILKHFSRNLPISSRLLKLFIVFTLLPSSIRSIVIIPVFTPNIGDLHSFALAHASQKYVNFVDLFNEPAFSFINFLYCPLCISLIATL